MADKPDLRVALFASGTEVASTNDAAIWLATMAAITGTVAPVAPQIGVKPSADPVPGASDPVAHLADELGVPAEVLIAACSPSDQPPFIHLDHKYWEALKQNTPVRGAGSVSGVVLAGTLLLLWNRHQPFGKVTAAMCDDVLETISHHERNRARSLRGCEWIQVRDDGLRLNPASVPAAKRVAVAYATRSPLR